MDALMTYLDMGGYAYFVWPAYGISAVSLIALLIMSLRSVKARQKEFDEMKALRRSGDEGARS